MPLLNSFQKAGTKDKMTKSGINYLPTIPKSSEYLVRQTYLDFLVDTM